MDLEFHQLDLRYESLRVVSPRRERKLLASIGETGQLVPISVVADETALQQDLDRYVVVDGFARVRVVRRRSETSDCYPGFAISFSLAHVPVPVPDWTRGPRSLLR